jgi:hypothetical protein
MTIQELVDKYESEYQCLYEIYKDDAPFEGLMTKTLEFVQDLKRLTCECTNEPKGLPLDNIIQGFYRSQLNIKTKRSKWVNKILTRKRLIKLLNLRW